jgi:hypothetical protein
VTVDEVQDKPWKQPGCVRRDCEPHRGPLLRFLAYVGAVWSALALIVAPAALLSLPLCVAVLRMARQDLARMSAGDMDPEGVSSTTVAKEVAEVCVAGGVAALCGTAIVVGHRWLLR